MISGIDQKLEVQQATDIVRLIGESVSLRAKGREYVGLCPFHDDHKPSMSVSPTKQIYKCFSCGAGGDVFSFMMNYHKLTFREALVHLAEQAGIKLKSGSGGGGDQGRANDREMIAAANDKAVGYYRAVFDRGDQGQAARAYVQGRRISEEMIRTFQIGCAPDDWEGLTRTVGQKGWKRHGFELAGLIMARRSGDGWIDRFRHRLIFPILDGLGRPIAFGARRLREDDDPKYLNSPETALFNKSTTLYGLHASKKAIIDSGTAVVVEGYTDVIACHQAGVQNVVATLGTSLTRGHASVLGRLCERVVLVFDADAAGQKAADRAVEVFLTGSLDVGVAVLAQGSDPAELLTRDGGVEVFRGVIDGAVDALEYKLSRLKDELEQTDTLTGRERIAQRFLGDLVALGVLDQGSLRRAMVVGRVAGLLGVGERAVSSELERLGRSRGRAPKATAAGEGDNHNEENNSENKVAPHENAPRIRALRLAERQVIGCVLQQPDLFHHLLSDGNALDEALTPGEMVTPDAQRLYECIYDRLSGDEQVTLAGVLADLASDDEHDLVKLATDADAEIEACCGQDNEKLLQILDTQTEAILRFRRERQYERKRPQIMETVITAARGSSDEALAEVWNHQREHPSVVKINRLERRK